MLPSGYTSVSGLKTITNQYIDTGVVPKNTLSVETLFSNTNSYYYAFGARNTNSNTSAGQLNYYKDYYNSIHYVGYASARINAGPNFETVNGGFIYFNSKSNNIEVVGSSNAVSELTGATTTFTGTRNIYLFGLNNAGNYYQPEVHSIPVIYSFKIWDDETLIRDYEPCHDGNSFGMYDHVNGTFSSVSVPPMYYLVTVGNSVGGQGYVKTFRNELVKLQYGSWYDLSTGEYTLVKLTAIADEGYDFLRWEDSNGNFISNEIDIEYSATADVTVIPIFVKRATVSGHINYRAMGLLYGKNELDNTSSFRDDIYAEVISAKINVDSLQRTTSTIVLKEMPSAFQINMPIFLFNPRGRVIYYGIIKNINGNSLECREPLSIFDFDFLFHSNKSIPYASETRDLTKYTALFSMFIYMQISRGSISDDGNTVSSAYQRRLTGQVMPNRNDYLSIGNNFTYLMLEDTETRVQNLEDYLLSLFNDYGVFAEPSFETKTYTRSGVTFTKHEMDITPRYIGEYDQIVLGDNVEDIADVDVKEEMMQTTMLYVYNASGTSMRNSYQITTEGEVEETYGYNPRPQYISYNLYLPKVIQSDDNLKSLAYQNLNNGLYNHKISFNLHLGGMYNLFSLKVGMPCLFYYKDKQYSSVVTGISFDVNENESDIKMIRVTLGKVRTKLTSKLNMGKTKR